MGRRLADRGGPVRLFPLPHAPRAGLRHALRLIRPGPLDHRELPGPRPGRAHARLVDLLGPVRPGLHDEIAGRGHRDYGRRAPPLGLLYEAWRHLRPQDLGFFMRGLLTGRTDPDINTP